ncbi:MAG: glycosyltransferase family 39 protein [Deltaproteobacteria bacterium]|nr:glycosyltransferase family 39 protein [Deltaproteobacteria bacterium]MDZ4341131.1 glycosyltransferase family 39 protein [Candidatus Binatia bacterium]
MGNAAPVRESFTAFSSECNFLLLGAGIVLRLVVFGNMGYLNNDNHLEVIEYVARWWVPPHADLFHQAYHPPLYYYLAAVLLHLGGVEAVHGLSLALSAGTLVLIALLLLRLPWINRKLRHWCLALAVFHPQFIMFSLFISNDTLAIFLGALIFYQCRRAQVMPSLFNDVLLGLALGLGLLTKAVFLAFLLPLLVFLWITGRQWDFAGRQLVYRLGLFILIAGILGCYKYVESAVIFGNPIISNVDFSDWARHQKPTWIGPRSLLDFDVFKLVKTPIISPTTVHSYPLMTYGSFWYSLIPESSFQSNTSEPLNRLGSLIYLVALCPTILMVIGAARLGKESFTLGYSTMSSEPAQDRAVYQGVVIFILLLNFLLIMAAGWRYDLWSVFQGRLLFPSYVAILLALHAGMQWAAISQLWSRIVRCLMTALLGLFVAYFVVEVSLAIVYPDKPSRGNHMPFKINMHAR